MPEPDTTREPRIADASKNCWKLAHANRISLLVDAAAFFRAFASAAERASHRIMVLAWDIDSRISLDPSAGSRCETLGGLFARLLAARPALHIHVLAWDFAMIYALEREPLTNVKFAWRRHPRLHFQFDGKHPVGASHHQKIIVIDDQVAFSGGLDLTSARWDTPEHRAHDERRHNVDGTPYPPFHDIQVMVDGEAAAALAEIARDRWQRATGEHLEPVAGAVDRDAWPPRCAADLTDLPVVIARTDPGAMGGEVREVEQLFVDSIAAARDLIFFETQYFTSHCVARSLAARLEAPEGPEIVIVTQQSCTGWLEELTMGVLRGRLLSELAAADAHKRLSIFYPEVDGPEPTSVNVHSKVTIVDDRFLRIGSANLSNRSMGLDTECDVAFEPDDAATRAAISRFRSRLVAEHLGLSPEAVELGMRESGSLAAVIRRNDGTNRTLRPLDCQIDGTLDALVPTRDVIDPERPLGIRELTSYFVPAGVASEPPYIRTILLSGGLLCLLVGLVVLLAFSPLRDELLNVGLLQRAASLRDSPLALPIVLLVYVVGTLCFVPLTALNLQAALFFGLALGALYAVFGSLTGSFAVYWLGRLLEHFRLWPWAGARVQRLRQRLSESGLLPVTMVRLLPIASNTLVCLVCGALRVRPRDFLLGSFIGLLPGITAMVLVGNQLEAALAEPQPWRVVVVVILLGSIVAFGLAISWWLHRREPARTRPSRSGGSP